MLREIDFVLVQISTGNNDAHIIQFDRENYNAPNLKKILKTKKLIKFFILLEQIYYL